MTEDIQSVIRRERTRIIHTDCSLK